MERNEIPGVVVFGLDGTLYSYEAYVRSCFRAVSKYVRVAYGWAIMDDLMEMSASTDMLGSVLGVLSRRAADVDDLLASRLDAVMVTHMPQIVLSPDARLCLALLARMGVRTAVMAAGDPAIQRLKVKALGLAGLVENIIYPGDLMGPDHAMEALQLLSMVFDRPPSSMMLVDHAASPDLGRARRLGMFSLGIGRGATVSGFEGAGCVSSLDAVPGLLAGGLSRADGSLSPAGQE